MYEQVEKPKENKSRSVANSVSQKKTNMKQGFGFVDNRSEAIVQKNMIGSTKTRLSKFRTQNTVVQRGGDAEVEEHQKKGIKFTRKIQDIQTELTLMITGGDFETLRMLNEFGYENPEALAMISRISAGGEGWFRSVAPIFEDEERVGAYQGGLGFSGKGKKIPASEAAGFIIDPKNKYVEFGEFDEKIGDGGTSRGKPSKVLPGTKFPELNKDFSPPTNFEVTATYLEAKAKYSANDIIAVFIDADPGDKALANAKRLKAMFKTIFDFEVPIHTLKLPPINRK